MLILRVLIIFLIGLFVAPAKAQKTLLCYYDTSQPLREDFLNEAIPYCTHLAYGFAGLYPNSFELVTLNAELDVQQQHRKIAELKQNFPQLKIYLSVGCDRDRDSEHPQKYVQLLEANDEQKQLFVDSSVSLLKRFGFHGLDLAFQLPRNKPRKLHNALGSYWKQFKKLFSDDLTVDKQAAEHKRQYTALAHKLKHAFERNNLELAMTVLPNVNSTWYFEPTALMSQFEYVNLAAFDFLTPARNPEEADFTAPIYFLDEGHRLPHYNIDYQVNYWLNHHWPASKLNVGIASYGRAWKLTKDSGLTGKPIVEHTDGPAPNGPETNIAGLLSWPEICCKLPNNLKTKFRGANAPLRSVYDLEQKYGNYALRPADDEGQHGVWVSYDDPDMAAIKASYAKKKGLGGMALFDLNYDDYNGICAGRKFPILKAIKNALE